MQALEIHLLLADRETECRELKVDGESPCSSLGRIVLIAIGGNVGESEERRVMFAAAASAIISILVSTHRCCTEGLLTNS